MKKLFWRGMLLTMAFLAIGWTIKKIIIFANNTWGGFYHLFIPLKKTPHLSFFLNNILLSVFSIICTILFFSIIGLLFGIRIKKKSLSDVLLRYFSRIPGVKFLMNLISQIIEASENIRKKKNKLAVFKKPTGERIFGIIRPEESELIYDEPKEKSEKTMPFYEAFTPYLFSGKPYPILTKYLYEIRNISVGDYVKYVATAGLFFKLPKKIFLKRIKNNKIEEVPTNVIIKLKKHKPKSVN